MNCTEIQQCLSAYHDRELSQELAAEVAVHLATCPSCAAELATFDRLSQMSRSLRDLPVPSHTWVELEGNLHRDEERSGDRRIMPNRVFARRLAIAATILIAAGISVFAFRTYFKERGRDHLAENFADFLEAFESHPNAAQKVMLVNYEGRQTTLTEAAAVLGYEPAVSKGLPAGCSLDMIYLLKMPCCTCTQAICRSTDGHSFAIFEHDSDQPVWFGDRPTVKCLCHDVPTSVVQVGDRLAATWKDGKRYITVIGANDLKVIVKFVEFFQGSADGNS